MPSEKKPSNKALKAEYLKGNISIAKLAQKHGISEDTLEKRSRREKWGDERRKISGKVAEEMPAAIAAIVLDEASKMTRSHLEDLSEAQRLARGLLSMITDPTALKDWAAAYKSIQSCQRLALGLGAPSTIPQGDTKASESTAGVTVVPADSDDWRKECEHGRA